MLSLVASSLLLNFAFTDSLPSQGYFDNIGRPVGDIARPILNPASKQAPFRHDSRAGQNTRTNIGAKSDGGLNVDLEWKNWAMGHGIGSAGLGIADLDGDGKNEIVASATPPGGTFAPNYFWYILEREADGAYRHQWVSDLYDDPISCLRLFDFDGDGRLDVCLSSGNTIFVYDGDTKAQLAAVTTSTSDIRGLSFADVDSDNQKEWVFVNSAALFIYSANGGLEQQLNG